MLAAPELTASESELLQQLLDEVDARRRGRVKTTLPFLLEIWNHWALLTARGYQLTLDEYVNGLFIREHIEQIIEHGPATVTEKIAPMIKQADGIFLAVTQAARRSLAPRYSRAGSVDWWWWRLPLRYSAEFERNLRRADLIDETTQ
jgi:hypothetical protein